MRILELDLTAFGPFSGERIDLSGEKAGMHIIYGLNEAGKSSALRALRGLLYGIPMRTTDSFLHSYESMRIGGRLRHSNGSELAFVRRKGTKRTLLSPEGKELEDGALDAYLGGVDERQFAVQFGLSYEALIEGAEELFEDEGGAGESLFAAGTGVVGLRKAMRELEEAAQELYLPRGSKQAVALAVREYNAARKVVREVSVSAGEWAERSLALEEMVRKEGKLAAERTALRAEKERLQRLRSALPKMALRRQRLERLAELGEVVLLPEGFGESRRSALADLEAARDAVERTQPQLARLKSELEGLDVPEELLAQEEAVTDLFKRSGSHIKAAEDLRDLRRQHTELMVEARAILNEVRPGLAMGEVERLRLDGTRKVRVQTLAGRHYGVEAELTEARSRVAEQERELAAAAEELEEAQAPRDLGELKLLLEEASARGDLAAARRQLVEEVETKRGEAETALAALPLWVGSLYELERLPVPAMESVERFDENLRELDSSIGNAAKGLGKIGEDLGAARKREEELRSGGSVPGVEELAGAREEREAGWGLVRRAWLGGEDVSGQAREYDPERGLPEAYEERVALADEMADTMRAEADRVAELSEVASRIVRLEEEEKVGEAGKRKLEEKREELLFAWAGLWQPLGIEPLPPREMRPWLEKQGKLAQMAADIREACGRLRGLEEEMEGHRSRLLGAMSSLGDAGDAQAGLALHAGLAQAGLGPVMQRARDMVEGAEQAKRRREGLEQRWEERKAELERRAQNLTLKEERMAEWRRNWEEALAALEMQPDALPEEVTFFVGRLDELFAGVDKAASLRGRIAGMERDAAQFAADVAGFVAEVAPDLTVLPPDADVGGLPVGTAGTGGMGPGTQIPAAGTGGLAPGAQIPAAGAGGMGPGVGGPADAEGALGNGGGMDADVGGLPVGTAGAGGLAPEQAASELNARLAKAKENKAGAKEKREQIEEKEAILEQAGETISSRKKQLDGFCRQAGCGGYDELEAAEKRSAEYAKLREDVESLDGELLELSGGGTLEGLLGEAEGVEADKLPGEIDDIEAKINELDKEKSALGHTIGSERQTINDMDRGDEAAEAEARAQGALASLQPCVERYLRLRTAAALLKQEVERYRRENQGPMLLRAGALFGELTCGSFSDLEVDYDDKGSPVIIGVRPSGERLSIPGMSDGTRDQLYLALRLAAVEKYLEGGEPMPFIVDDILISFDDERAEAALKSLLGLSARTQVIFFTHHARLVELAESMAQDGDIRVHTL